MDESVGLYVLSLKKYNRKFGVEMIVRQIKVRPTDQVVLFHVPPLKTGQGRAVLHENQHDTGVDKRDTPGDTRSPPEMPKAIPK